MTTIPVKTVDIRCFVCGGPTAGVRMRWLWRGDVPGLQRRRQCPGVRKNARAGRGLSPDADALYKMWT